MSEYGQTFIEEHLAHRYPFLMVDRVLNIDFDNNSIQCIKNVSLNEPYFTGHFPGNAVMPGVMMIEALAQAGCIYASSHYEEIYKEKLGLLYLARVEKASFKKIVTPGDQLVLKVTWVRYKPGRLYIGQGEALVDGEVACSVELKAIGNNSK
jgi:3-hydroxyacyl-[acyl-carrier-protein] dehydratase